MAIKTIRVCLTNDGEDRETPWAFDLGPAPGPKGSRKVRLVNVPFMHAKPTWGDVIVVTPRDGVPTWDRATTPFILEDGGRRPMVVEYVAHGNDEDCSDAIAAACAVLEIVCESSFLPKARSRARAYLAVQRATTDQTVMRHLSRAFAAKLTQVFPRPAQ